MSELSQEMATNASRHHFLTKLFLLTTLCTLKSEESCIVKKRKNFYSHCDSLEDLYSNASNFQKEVVISGTNTYGELKIVPVESARDIEELTINEAINKVSDDAFKNFLNLKSLYVSSRKIEKIQKGVFRNLNLKPLDFSQCGVTVIENGSFENLTQLQVLRFRNNNLTEIKKGIFGGLKIWNLVLSFNQIKKVEKLSFGDMPNLGRLYLDHNQLIQFNVKDYVKNASQMERLWLHNNNITEVTIFMLEGLTNLKVLNLASNRISSVEPKSFSETPKLTTLVLSNNLLKLIDGGILPSGGLTDLRTLYLDHNKLMFLSSNFLFRLNSLKGISVGGNSWNCLCLDLVLRWLADNNVKLNCDQNYFNGERPVCVVPSKKHTSVCVYNYDEEMNRFFQENNKMYPVPKLCFL